LCKDPEQRFSDGAALVAAVDDVLAGRPPVPVGPSGTAVMPLPPGGRTTAARSGRRTPLRRVLLGAAVALAVLTAAAVALQSGPGTPAEGTTTEETTPATVPVAADDYVGKPVAEVQAALIALGLQVAVVPVETSDAPPGQVIALDPVGDLAPDQTVTVSYAVPPVVVPAPPPAQNGDDQKNDEKKGEEEGKEEKKKGKDKEDD
jgi:hypothetical protein